VVDVCLVVLIDGVSGVAAWCDEWGWRCGVTVAWPARRR